MTDLLAPTSTEAAPTASDLITTTPTPEVQTMTDSTLIETPVATEPTPIVSAPIETPAADAPVVEAVAEIVSAPIETSVVIEDNTSATVIAAAIATETPVVETAPTAIDTILFVDSSVSNYQDLLIGLGNNVEVVLLTNDQEGVLQMAAALQGRSDLASIQILSHGSNASVEVGSNVLNSNNLASYTNELAQIGAALSETGDILLFGCNVAQDAAGVAFVNNLAAATGADVSASNDLTGLGGNWTLEVASGAIEAATVITAEAQAGYVGTLTTDNAPVFSGISIAGNISSDAAVAYTTHGTAVVLDADVAITDGDSPGTYTGATLTLVRSGSSADANDVFTSTLSGNVTYVDSSSFSSSGGTLTVTLATGISAANVNTFLQSITYAGTTLGAADINWTFYDNTGDAQASGYSSIFVNGEAPVATAATVAAITDAATTGNVATTTGAFSAISDANSDTITAAVTAVSAVAKIGGSADATFLTALELDTGTGVNAFLDKFILDPTYAGGTGLTWTFSPADAFDELASGQSLEFTYTTTFEDNSAQTLTTPVDTVITISGANDAPTVSTALSDTALVVGSTGAFLNLATNPYFKDVDYLDTLTYTITVDSVAYDSTVHTWLTFSAGVFTQATTTSAAVGDHVIVVTATDTSNATITDTFIVEISNEAIVGITDTDLFVNTSGSDTFAGTYGNTEAVSYSQAAAESGTTGVTVVLPELSDSSPAATNVVNSVNGTDSFLNIDNLIGSDYNDTLTGNAAVNVIYGGSGNDTITGTTGGDTLYGGAGDDEIHIASLDHVYGDAGIDAIIASEVLSAATITGGAGADTLQLVNGTNLLHIGDTDGITITGSTTTGVDTIDFDAAISAGSYIGGTSGVDVINLTGASGATNTLTVNDALVSITGAASNDDITFITTALATGTVVDGAAGTDSVILPATLNTATFKDVETVTGTAGLTNSVLTITGDSATTVLAGVGTQTITSTSSALTTITDSSNQVTILNTGTTATGNYAVTAGTALITLTATSSTGTLNITAADATSEALTIAAGTGNITVAGTGTTDTITVNDLNAANQSFTGTTASDVTAKFVVNGAAGTSQSITTGSGADTITGGGGADSIVTGDGADVIKFASATDLAAVTTVDGGAGTADKIYITAAELSLVDSNFTAVTGVETLQLTGASTAVLGTNAADTGKISTVIAGDASTTLTSTGTGALLVDLATAQTPTLITGAASANYTVTGAALTTTIDASTSTGTLLVNAADVTSSAITLTTGSGNTSVVGGAAEDVYTVTGLATSTGAQTFTGTVSNFTITSSSTGSGVSISTAAGSDTIVGGAGNDTISSGAESDTITGGAGNDSLNGGDGNDLYLFNTSDVVTGETLVDSGSETADTIKVVTSTDFTNLATATILTAGHVEQVLITSATTATFTGAQLTGQAINVNATAADAANLVINVAPSGTVDFTSMTFTATSGDAFTTAVDTVAINVASGTADITGTTLKDTITVTQDGATTIHGGTGEDVLNITSGNVVYGDDGIDAIVAAAALTSATITGGALADTLLLAAGTNTLHIGDTDGIAITGATGANKDDITFDAAISNTSYTAGAGTTQDVITLANGSNTITITDVDVSVVGGTGTDAVTMGVGINVGTFKNIETVTNTAGSASSVLTIQGSSATTVVANAGASTVTSTSGALTTVDLDTNAGTDLKIGASATGRYVVTGDALTTAITATGSSSQITYNAFAAATTAIATGTGNVVVVAGAANDNMTVTGLARASQIFVGSVGDFNITSGSTTGVGVNITTGAGSDTITGGAGNDIISAGADSDTIDGGAGADTLSGGNGNDTYFVDNASDKVIELSSNTDSTADLISSSISYTLPLYVEKLTITGTGANFTATGNNLANTITGGAGNDSINGGTGADSMDGGSAGADTYVVDNTGDVVTDTVVGGTEVDLIQSSVTFTMATNVENMTLTGRLVINGTGNDVANTIIGNISNNILKGEAGNDLLQAGLGNDTLYGGAGQDTLTGGGGVDRFVFDSTYVSEAVVDTITDFSRTLKEKIDVSAIVSGATGDAFTFIGTSAFSGLGQLRYNVNSGTIQGNTTGDTTADFTITVTGGTVFTAADFIL